jgi:gamma-glutamyltranspeptidase/glutathione hydrolase
MRPLLSLLIALLVLSSSAQAETGRGDRVTGASWATRSAVLGTHGMVATSQPLVSQIALDVLKDGGSAVDAAIAANAALGLMEPTGSGIGGDLFAIVWDPKTEKLHGLNASGRSAAALTLEQLRERIGDQEEMPNWGVYPVTVPGAVDGWFELHAKFGRLPMRRLLQPAIDYAREGYPVSQLIAYYMGASQRAFERLHGEGVIEEIDNYRATYLIDGKAPVEGQVFRNPDLAATYELLATEGRDAYYRGPIAATIDAYMQRLGGPLRASDFASHRSEWVDTQSVSYRGYELHELPPNGQGIAALQMLKILEGFDLAAMGHNSAQYLHVQAEAKKLVFEDRARFYADMDFYEAPLERLLSDEYAAERRALIRLDKASTELPAGDIAVRLREARAKLQAGDTIYLTTADGDGMMVSLIQSNYRGMGTGLVPDGLGFMLQDRGALFTLEEGHPNAYAPGKRPFHTIIPAFLTKDGRPIMSYGVMGGAMQPQGHVQIVCNMIDFGMGVQEAGDAARYHHTGSTEPSLATPMSDGGVLELESGVSEEVRAELTALGHAVRLTKGPFGGYQAVWRDPATGVYWGASEMRKDGAAMGY